MTTSVILSEETAEGLRQIATDMGLEMPILAEQAIRQYLRREADKKVHREEQLYQTHHGEFLTHYRGRYIALHHGAVVDSDADELVLYQRIRETYPMVGILIKHVTPQVDEVWHVYTPRYDS